MESEPGAVAGQSERSGRTSPLRWIVPLLAASCGLLVANVYYAQPLAGPIGLALGLTPAATGLVVTFGQIGYGTGLLTVVPLGDLTENRRLVVALIWLVAAASLAAGFSSEPIGFLSAAFVIGVGSAALQVLVPYAAHMAAPAEQGRVIGNVSFGLMLGIMLARPFASFVTQISSWHVVFFVACAAMAALATVLALVLPPRRPGARLHYGRLLGSMGHLIWTTPVLRRRGLYQACLFGAFSLFWTTAPLLLAGPFHLSQGSIALFALVGVAGAIAAPIAGRLADRGLTKIATAVAMACVAAAFLVSQVAQTETPFAIVILLVAAVVLDFGMSANLTLGQRAIFALGSDYRGRLNGLYLTILYIGGAIGSAVGGWAYARGGWSLTCWIGLAFAAAALAYFATE
jgi:predicted MFS family arabinose efflux permease